MVAVQMNFEKLLVSEVNAAEMAKEVPRVPSPRLVRLLKLAGSPWGCIGYGVCVLKSLRSFLEKSFNCWCSQPLGHIMRSYESPKFRRTCSSLEGQRMKQRLFGDVVNVLAGGNLLMIWR